MARTCTYSKRDLQQACSKVKRKVQSNISSGKLDITIFNKTYLFNEVAKKLKLKSGSAFHKTGYEYYEYLNNWYKVVSDEIKEFENNKVVIKSKSDSICKVDVSNENNRDIIIQLKEKDDMIDYLNNVIKQLRMENESLRLKRIHRLHKLDVNKGSDILDETIDANEIKELYNLISKLYNATFDSK